MPAARQNLGASLRGGTVSRFDCARRARTGTPKPKPKPAPPSPPAPTPVRCSCGRHHSEHDLAVNSALAAAGVLEVRDQGGEQMIFRGDLDQLPRRGFLIHPSVPATLADQQWHRVHFCKLEGWKGRRELRLYSVADPGRETTPLMAHLPPQPESNVPSRIQ
jgi:hypothetical protein